MSIDLHIHSIASDGEKSPLEIVKEAKSKGLSAISITDHDTIAGVEETIEIGKRHGVEVIPGVEINTEIQKGEGEEKVLEIHILGYFIDYRDEKFQKLLSRVRELRINRIKKMIEKLKRLGIKVEDFDILREAEHHSVGRPHVARALIKAGYVNTIEEAFQKYLGVGKPAYVQRGGLTPEDAIQAISLAEGIPVFAHPGLLNRDEEIVKMMKVGLMGIEAYYGKYNQEMIEYYLSMAKRLGLLVTGGSDFHGEGYSENVAPIGTPEVPDEVLEKLKEVQISRVRF